MGLTAARGPLRRSKADVVMGRPKGELDRLMITDAGGFNQTGSEVGSEVVGIFVF
jgi:hypothetical protein